MQNKNLMILAITTIVVIAGIADLKYKGLFFQLLPASIQKCLAGNDESEKISAK